MAEDLCRGSIVKTLSWSVIIGTDQAEQALIGQCGQISFPRQSSAHASDGVFNPALLPGGMRVTEKGAHREFVEAVMVSELSAIIEGDSTT